jgi:hypothetical protein
MNATASLILALLLISPFVAWADFSTSDLDPKLINEMIERQHQYMKDHNQVSMESVMEEATVFIDYLRICYHAFPNTSDEIRGYSLDQANAPVISYPFKLKATLYPEAGNHDYTVVILNKLSSDAPWRIEDAWKATIEDKRTGDVAIPTNASQDKGNKKLPSLMVKGARIDCP